MRLIFFFILLIFLCSCSSRSDYTRKYKINQKTNSEVPFIAQEEFQCGPATLAMVMNFRGLQKKSDDLSAETFTPDKKGSFQADMISSVRRNKLLAVTVTSFKNLLLEVNAGNPVIVLQNLGLSWYPRWHYAVVKGFDLKKSEMILHSGKLKDTRLGFFTFRKTWDRSENWGLLILRPGEIAATASELEMVRATAHLEAMKFYPEAVIGYENILKKWPESLGARIGLGNAFFNQKDLKRSVLILKEATEKFPGSAEAWHNYALALMGNNQVKEAKIAAKAAIEKCHKEYLNIYQQNLSELIR